VRLYDPEFHNVGQAVRLYKCTNTMIDRPLWGAGNLTIDPGVTATVIRKRGVTIVDNSTAGETRYYAEDTCVVDEINVKNQIKLGLTGATITKLLTGTKVFDWASLASGATALNTTVTVTGAALGDVVLGCSMSVAVPAGCFLQGQVTGADTVTVTLYNISGGAVDLASGTLRAVVARVA
jgi:hypothetical protein